MISAFFGWFVDDYAVPKGEWTGKKEKPEEILAGCEDEGDEGKVDG